MFLLNLPLKYRFFKLLLELPERRGICWSAENDDRSALQPEAFLWQEKVWESMTADALRKHSDI